MPSSAVLDRVERKRLLFERRGDGTQVLREDEQLLVYLRCLLSA